MKLILPIVLALAGVAAGVGAGFVLPGDKAAPPAAEPADAPEKPAPAAPEPRLDAEALADREFVKMNNQFVIPIVTQTRVASLVVLSLTLEVEAGQAPQVYGREPKLRDLFLQVMFDQASLGRFSGEFTSSANLAPLREELRIVARRVLGDIVSDVLITEIARQDN